MTHWRADCATVAAQAKLNLSLRVLNREADGYHQVETLYCRIDLADVVKVRLTAGPRLLDVAGDAMPREGLGPVEQNLSWRAADLYLSRAGRDGGFAIEITKRIPVGGGLGGGSADAAAVLRALDALAVAPLGAVARSEIERSLGADVAFLAGNDLVAFARGRGDVLEPLGGLPPRNVLLLHFPFGVPTTDAYRWLAQSRTGAPPRAASAMPASRWTSWARAAEMARNDFESVVPCRFPPIETALRALRAPGAKGVLGRHGFALLCGSGATVAAVGDANVSAADIAELVPASIVARRLATATAVRVEEVLVGE